MRQGGDGRYVFRPHHGPAAEYVSDSGVRGKQPEEDESVTHSRAEGKAGELEFAREWEAGRSNES